MSDKQRRVRELFRLAADLRSRERQAFLDANSEDPEVRAEVECLLTQEARIGSGDDDRSTELPVGDELEGLANTQPRDLIGQTVSHYQVVEKLGAGGMGVVYRAKDRRLSRSVALKFLPEGVTLNSRAVERFTREARATSALNHPNIITIHEIAATGSLHFIVMELVEGRTLRAMSVQRIPMESLKELGAQAARALAVAHAAGIIHRDIKPENVMVRDDGYVKILDFGLARLMPERMGAVHEQTNAADTGRERSLPYSSSLQARLPLAGRCLTRSRRSSCHSYKRLHRRPATGTNFVR